MFLRTIKFHLPVIFLIFIGCSSDKENALSNNGQNQTGTQVLFLDSAERLLNNSRPSSTVILLVNGKSYVFNAGQYFLQRYAVAKKANLVAQDITEVDNYFFTDLQSDLSAGIPDILFIKMVVETSQTMNIHGPEGMKPQLNKLLEDYTDGFTVEGFALNPVVSDYDISINTLIDGEIYSDDLISVKAFPVKRGDLINSYSYAIKTPHKSLVISGDISYSPTIAENCLECDMLIHSVASEDGLLLLPESSRDYQRKFHTFTNELGGLAAVSRPKVLILYNQLYYGVSDSDLISEMGKYFSGDITSAKAFDIY
jgi:ribonuclease BN (tRNA processing enzyme)|tara:strand:- start:4044 stop:4979 length:936 start_codon:yes stop_codon:yes gene_type:complete